MAPGEEAKNIRPETLDRIEKLLREADAATLIRRMQEVEAMLRAGRVAGSQNEARQLAERLEVLAQRLDALHRAVVAPQLESLIALEKRAAELRERLKKLDSQAAISQWHRDADLLLQELGRLKARSALGRSAGRSDAGAGLGNQCHSLGLEPRRRLLRRSRRLRRVPGGDRDGTPRGRSASSCCANWWRQGDEPTPPQYKELVERYFQVLSQAGIARRRDARPRSNPR